VSALESLRRSIRNTLLLTDLLVGALPLVFAAQFGMDPVRIAILAPGALIFLVSHTRSVLRALQTVWQPFSLRRSYALAALAIALACLLASAEGSGGAFASLYTGLAVSEFAIGRDLRSTYRHAGVVLAVHCAALAATIVLTGQFAAEGVSVVYAVVLVVFTGYGVGVAYRQWEQALKLEEARIAADELATTRERLRLAEDLHDILGHALEVVSLKSELAARLDDPAQARAEMTEVQRLARNALKDVRALAKGNRPTDLATELTGARKLLDSAGIRCDFDADPTELSDLERELFGRVLREAMTNVLRHADPRTCTVTLSIRPDSAQLRIVNDGTVPLATSEQGSGLIGLARRLKAVDGQFTAHGVAPSSFEVIASVPR
jgi:two-component system, NarL family, sensor histidine kinase DesK